MNPHYPTIIPNQCLKFYFSHDPILVSRRLGLPVVTQQHPERRTNPNANTLTYIRLDLLLFINALRLNVLTEVKASRILTNALLSGNPSPITHTVTTLMITTDHGILTSGLRIPPSHVIPNVVKALTPDWHTQNLLAHEANKNKYFLKPHLLQADTDISEYIPVALLPSLLDKQTARILTYRHKDELLKMTGRGLTYGGSKPPLTHEILIDAAEAARAGRGAIWPSELGLVTTNNNDWIHKSALPVGTNLGVFNQVARI